ncbi:gamma-tubulin complex component 4-like [Punica granatum]|uniref:Gamma-tubulin complex component n=1 Tax=Punica granatum TaxID=22663 RepID=A0A6P8BW89_PUNGR|nr:gamma-tubulin complex component 4-like [Punica granatum]
MPSFGLPVKLSQLDISKGKPNAGGNSGTMSTNTSSEVSLDGWDGISLDYSIDWPLGLFFTQEVLSKYQKVFQYLLLLKRIEMELDKSWASVMHQDNRGFAKYKSDNTNSTPQRHRQHFKPMWRVDVIESQMECSATTHSRLS